MRYPDTQTTILYFGYGTLLYMQFFIVYGLANWISSSSDNIHHLYFEWETRLPFISYFIIPYLSLSLFLILPLFYIDKMRLKQWAKTYMYLTFLAGLIFLLLPTAHVYGRQIIDNEYKGLYDFLYMFDLPHNLFPSLHVALTTLVIFIIWRQIKGRMASIFILTWWGLMTMSVVLVRQHHIPDIIGGILLAYICYSQIYLKE